MIITKCFLILCLLAFSTLALQIIMTPSKRIATTVGYNNSSIQKNIIC
jgi:hypothetical protein